jgi:hypothetical protein
MWSAVVLICNLSVAPIFENNEVVTITMLPSMSCYMSINPKWDNNKEECLLTVSDAMRNPKFVREDNFQIFSFECFQWANHHYLGVPT